MKANASPFQIIYAENVLINDTIINGDSRSRLINQTDKISLKNGHLMMVHYLGEFFEFEGDTNIFISDLIYNQYGIFDADISARPKIGRLFEEEPFYNNLVTGAIIRENHYGLEFLVSDPNIDKYQIQKDKSICLFWDTYLKDTQDSMSYEVELKNIFDERIGQIKTESKYGQLAKLDSYENPSNLIIAKVNSNVNEETYLTTMDIALELTDKPSYYYPTLCDVSASAIKNLEMAFYLENSTEFKRAEKHYRAAAELSSNDIYQEILKLYLKRSDIEY